MDEEDQAKIKHLMASVQAQTMVRKNGDPPISPEEGLNFVQAFVGVRSPALRRIILNLINELAKETS